MNLTKTKYVDFMQCPKMAWLEKYNPSVGEEMESSAQTTIDNGHKVGELAKSLFEKGIDATSYDKDGKLDIPKMLKKTRNCIANGEENIFEAAFENNGLYCAVDILQKNGDGYDIFEVKSSTKIKPSYLQDTAYQKYVLEKCGVKVNAVHLVHVNAEYVRRGELNLKEFFVVEDITDDIATEYSKIEDVLLQAEKILSQTEEPKIGVSENCKNPHDCRFWKYCTKNCDEKNSVFGLYRMSMREKTSCFNNGIVSYSDIQKANIPLNPIQKRQVEFALEDKNDFFDRKALAKFLSQLYYPLYFLDFESIQPLIPLYDGTKPFSQVPFQYSLHCVESENSELKHFEFLADADGTDPRRALAERLREDIPENACVLAYNKTFECLRIKEMAELFPDLAEHLLKIRQNVVDLLTPFQKGFYYSKRMGGSFSIKSVLPALFPNDKELDYHNLSGVHNGTEAMDIFPKMQNIRGEELEEARKNLLEYCKLDTLAMVKIWQKLLQIVQA